MKTVNIKIKEMYGISTITLNNKSVELTGRKGTGKSSVLDAVRYALANDARREWVIRDGASEGEIIVETDTGLAIDRKARNGRTNTISVTDNGNKVTKPETFLKTIITPLQLNPVEFTQMSKQEQNRVILNLIEFDWDLNWIQQQFGEIPQGVNYGQHILQVLNDIQSEQGVYYRTRQDVNRDIRNKSAFIHDISLDIPGDYQAERWEHYDLSEKYNQLIATQKRNGKISSAKAFYEGYNNKLRGLEADRDIKISVAERAINAERDGLNSTISRLKAEIQAAQDKLLSLNDKLKNKVELANAEYETGKAQLDSETRLAEKYASLTPTPTDSLQSEISEAEAMIKHLNEYKRMRAMQDELEELKARSEELTSKIELARTLPGMILQNAELPVEGLTVKDGIPLINGLPISNRSDGELLELCVDIAISKPGNLQIILIDGAEKLDDESRNKLYAKCKAKGLQFIATRTTNDNELIVTEL